MKLVTAIVHNEDAANLVDALLEGEYRATRLHSSGGFLKQGNATILVGVDDDKVDAVIGYTTRVRNIGVDVRLNVKNITDEHYLNGTFQYGEPRTFIAGVGLRF